MSTATVSRALNGKPGVSADVRQKVIDLAGQLRYTPNPAAQNLATAKTYAVALAIRRRLVHTDNPFYDRVMMGIEMELEKQGYYLVMITIDEEQHEKGWLPPGLDRRRLDGLIVVGPELSGRTMTTLLALGLPTVLVGNSLGHTSVDAVTSKNQEGGYLATQHLIDHGHEHIAFLGGPLDWSPIRDRQQGYRRAIQQHGLAANIVTQSSLNIEAGRRTLAEALAQNPKISAIFAANDPMAIGAMQAARELGRTVPDDLAVVGYDNIPWSETTEPPLTTVYIQKQQMGKLAARRILDVMNEGPQPAVDIFVENELLIRRSCGCPPTEGS